MTKTIKNLKRQEKEKLSQIKCVQDSIPFQEVYEDGIFLLSDKDADKLKKKGIFSSSIGKKYSATYRIRDISYLTLSDDMQKSIFFAWSSVLNILEPGAINKLNVIKHRMSSATVEKFLIKNDNPQYRNLRDEYNKLLIAKAAEGSGMVQEVYLTVSVFKKDIEQAKSFFLRTTSALQSQLTKLGSYCDQLNAKERIELLHDIYRPNDQNDPPFIINANTKRKMLTSAAKNYIAPNSMEWYDDYFRIGGKYGRAMVVHSYPTYLKDSIVSDLCDINKNIIFTMDIMPVPMDEAVKEAQDRAAGVEANISKWFQKQYANKNFAMQPPYHMEQQRAQAQEYIMDLTERDQQLMYVVVTIVHFADTKEQLDEDSDSLSATARTAQCRLNILRWQQLDGLNTALPIGMRYVEDVMTLTTEGVAGFMPFKSNEIQDEGGYFYGINQITKNLIMINPTSLRVANCVALGTPGSGKSMLTKFIALNKAMATASEKHEIILIDPEREYGPLVEALGGEIVYLHANSKSHINAMEINNFYDTDDNPIVIKTDFMISLCSELIKPAVLGPKERSLIGRCTELTLGDYYRNGCVGQAPTLIDFHHCLLAQPEKEAHDLALSLEIYTVGALSTFAQQTNIDINNRIICYDINELGENLKSVGMLVLLDNVMNRITRNRAKKVTTSVIVDEFYLMFSQEYTSEFFYKQWKRGRKYGSDMTAVTQNVEDLLRSPNARAVLSTSEILILLNQAPLDREQLSKILNISETQMKYITDVKPGSGLIQVGENMIPFENDIPKDSQIYKLLTTKLDEAIMIDQ